ncbi:MAG: glycosidase-like protein, partial [Actinomycetota bacterium]
MSPADGPAGLVTRTELRLAPDPSRTLSRLFVPGQETLIQGQSRATLVINRVLAMSEAEAERVLARTMDRFGSGYRDLAEILDRNYALVAHGAGGDMRVSAARRRLIGAYFTQQYALEAAALFNPSIVAHPDQSGCGAGEVRFVLSLRAVGEGHLSSIEFRTGTIGAGHEISIDPPGRFLDAGTPRPVDYDRALFRTKLAELGHDDENAQFLWSLLPPRFTSAELDSAIAELSLQCMLRGDCAALMDGVRWMAASTYEVEFDPRHDLSERVLWPSGPAESHGMEDARFVRFAGGDQPVYLATYSAFDGRRVASHLLETRDFQVFAVSPLSGQSTRNKGMAIFPRHIGGRYAALSRWDRESNGIAYSDDGRRWGQAVTLQAPARPWDAVQLGNCGSPLETP